MLHAGSAQDRLHRLQPTLAFMLGLPGPAGRWHKAAQPLEQGAHQPVTTKPACGQVLSPRAASHCCGTGFVKPGQMTERPRRALTTGLTKT